MLTSGHTKSDCENEYNTTNAKGYGVVCTLLILIFTVFLELGAHWHASCCNTISDDMYHEWSRRHPKSASQEPTIVDEQPEPQTAPHFDTSQNDTSTAEPAAQKKPPPPDDCCTGCPRDPSPNIRANRLIIAIFLYAVVLTAFISRIRDIEDPYIRPECTRYVWRGNGSIPGPNWWAVAILNIVPFIAASFSLMRTVVDCLLVRWGLHLKYVGEDGPDGWLTWPTCMPFFLVFVCVRAAFRLPITLLMGRPRDLARPGYTMVAGGDEDIEMRGGESRRLVNDHDSGDYQGEGSGPPAYDYAVHDRGNSQAVAGKGGSS